MPLFPLRSALPAAQEPKRDPPDTCTLQELLCELLLCLANNHTAPVDGNAGGQAVSVALTAASGLVALAAQPDTFKLPPCSEHGYRGPFRELLLRMEVVPLLLRLGQASWGTATLQRQAHELAAAGCMLLLAPGVQMPHADIDAVIEHVHTRACSGHLGAAEYQMLAAALRMLLRHPAHCEHIHARQGMLSASNALMQHGIASLLNVSAGVASSLSMASGAAGCFAWLASSSSLATGLESAVLVTWRLLQLCFLGASHHPQSGSVYGRTNASWWELPAANTCAAFCLR